jgi:serine protease Do
MVGAAGLLLGAAVIFAAQRMMSPRDLESMPARGRSDSESFPGRDNPEAGNPDVPSSPWLAPDDIVVDEGQIHSRFTQLAKYAAPAVVNVHTSKTVVQSLPQFPFPELFRDFFGGDPFRGPSPDSRSPRRAPQRREFRVPSLGTGFVISEDGYIVTNQHVVEGVDEIEVRFLDGETAKAEVIGEDPKTDLALIRVTGVSDLHVLPLGDSDEILPGDWVVAIGNPFGLSHTVTVGIVSAKGREIGQGPYDDFIQTDAAINPGNSGGPLLNMRGEVVGINTAINPQANTIGFAVPSNLAQSILPQLRETGFVVRGWLGVAVQPVTEELQKAFDLPARKGALISQVTPGSPADKAGLERGDVIVRFDGDEVEEMRDLPILVAATPVGTEVEIEVYREGSPRVIQVEIGKLEDTRPRAEPGDRSGLSAFGLRVEDLTPTLRQRFDIERSDGVVVSELDPNGPAAAAGIREGDVILEVNRQAVGTAAEVARVLRDADSALILISRNEATLFVTLRRME